MPRIVREATVTWQGSVARGGGRAAGGTGAFDLPVDLPARIDETATKTSPEELLAAAHAACFTMSLGGEIARAGGKVEALGVRCVVTMDEVGGKGHLVVASELDADVRAEGIDAETLDRVATIADEGCPMSALIRATARVTVTARLSSD